MTILAAIFACLFGLCALALLVPIAQSWLAIAIVARVGGERREAETAARPLADDECPHIVVQIPVFNEGRIVDRAVFAATRLDWPRDRLHVQVLDDSTDATVEYAEVAVLAAKAARFDAVLLRRANRANYKAGALAAGMAASPHGYFAVLDVDFLPNPDFLRRVMPALLSDERLAFVQARIDHLNPQTSALTCMQAALMDAHYAVEQPARAWGGLPLPFNGTAGVWRRSVVDAAGGWRGDTVAEDLDLSYRAWAMGHPGTFLTTVTVAGELPDDLEEWRRQQERWSMGTGQVARRVLPNLSRAKASLASKIGAALHLGSWAAGLAGQGLFLFGALAVLLAPATFSAPIGATLLAFVAAGLVTTAASIVAGRRAAGRSGGLAADARGVLLVLGFGPWLILRNLGASLDTLRGRLRAWSPTAKKGD